MRTVVRSPLNFAWALAMLALSLPPAAQAGPADRPPEGTPAPTGEQPPPAASPSGRKLPRSLAEQEIARHFDSPKTRSHVLRVGTEAGIIEAEPAKPAKPPKPEAAAPAVAAPDLRPGQSVKLGALQSEAVQAGAPATTRLPTPEEAAALAGGNVRPDLAAMPAVSADIMGQDPAGSADRFLASVGADNAAQPGNLAIPVLDPPPVAPASPPVVQDGVTVQAGPVQLGSPDASAHVATPADMTGAERGPGMSAPRVSVDGGLGGPKVEGLSTGESRSADLPSATGSDNAPQGAKRGGRNR